MSFTVELGKTFSVSSEPLGIWMGTEGGERERERRRSRGRREGEEMGRGEGKGDEGGGRRNREGKRLVEWRRQKSRVGK